MEELNQALTDKATLADKAAARSVNDYYYNETVTVKHRKRVMPGVWDHPTYSQHQELRFNSGKYHQDLGGINAAIQQYLTQINELVNSLELLTAKNQLVADNQSEVVRSEGLKKQAENQLAQTKANLTAYIKELTVAERANIVASEINNPDAEFLIETIYELGVDYNVLATIAIDRADAQLLDFALHSGANLDKHITGDHTLLQHSISQGNSAIINMCISFTKNFYNSLFYALLQNDFTSLKAILSVDPELSGHLLFEDYNLAHYAIAHNQKDILDYIISIHPDSLKVDTCNGDSAFKIALRSGNNEMVQQVAQHVDLSYEYTCLRQAENTDLIDRAIALNLAPNIFVARDEVMQQLESPVTCMGDNDLEDTGVVGSATRDEIDVI